MNKIVAINASPRGNWNTAQLVKAAANGVKDNEVEVEYIDLYSLEKFTGCISCFGCKLDKTYGKCICKDGLYEVLEKIRNADGLIIGSPIYLSDLTAGFKSLYERLVFQYLTYNVEKRCCNEHKIPVLLIATSNCAEERYEAMGYHTMLENYKNTLSAFVGPTEVFVCGDTLQVNDYSKYTWTMFDPEHKRAYHNQTFDSYLAKAYKLGQNL